MHMMRKVIEEAHSQEAALVLEDKTPPQPPTQPAAAAKTPATHNHQADLATTVDGAVGLYALTLCLAKGYMLPPLLW